MPICKTEPPKLSPENPGGRVRDSTYRRISCLVRNVKSWKAEREGGQRAVRRPRPPCRLLRDPAPERRPARRLPRAQRPAHLVLGQ